jgi:hypothetical protein
MSHVDNNLDECNYLSWRRKAGNDVNRASSLDRTRQFMGHAPDSKSYLKYYDKGTVDIPVFEITMDADLQLGIASTNDDAPPALTRTVNQVRIWDVFLERAVLKLEWQSSEMDEAQNSGDLRAIRLIKARIRKSAESALYQKSKEMSDESLTMGQVQSRRAELAKSGYFMASILARAQQSVKLSGNLAYQREEPFSMKISVTQKMTFLQELIRLK